MKKSIVLIFSILLSLSLNAQWEKTNASFGGNINVLEVSGNNIFAGTDEGVYLSVDNGSSWTQMNNGLTNTMIYSMVIVGTDVFVGTGGKGVFVSSDNGKSWIAVNKGMSNSDVRSLYFYNNNLFAGTENDGIFLSSDKGKSWNSINNGLDNYPIRTFLFSGGLIYAGTNGGGLFATSDNGNKWFNCSVPLNPIQDPKYKKINALASINALLFVGTEGGLYSLYGTTPSFVLTTFSINSLKVDGTKLVVGTKPAGYDYNTGELDPYIIWENFKSSSYKLTGNYGVMVSSDYGKNWTPMNKGLSHKPVVALSMIGKTIIAGTLGCGIYISSDQGSTWYLKNKGIGNAKITSIISNNTEIYVGTYGSGIHKSIDGGNTWAEINNGIPNYQITSMTISGNTLFAGTEGLGLYKSTDGGNTWIFSPYAGKYMKDYIIDDLLTCYELKGNKFYVSKLHTDASGKVYVVQRSPGELSCYIPKTINKINLPSGIYTSTDLGNSWTYNNKTSNIYYTNFLTTSGSYIYAGDNFSSNNGFSWSKNPVTVDGVDYAGLCIETIGNRVLIGTEFIGVITSNDNGDTWNYPTYTLYNSRVNVLAKISNESVFAGTENGVFYSKDFFSTVTNVNSNLLDTNIVAFAIVGSDIYAGTLNGKIWKRSISDIIQPPLKAGIISGASFVCEGQKNVNYSIPEISNSEFYIWKFPNGKVDTTKTNTINISFESNDISGNLSVYATNYFGDGQVSTQFITISKLPSVVATASKTAVCSGESVSLTGTGASTYKWDNNVSNGVAFVPSATKTYTVTGTDANGCINTAIVNVTVNKLPSVVAIASKTAICTGESVTLTGSGASTYIWDNNVNNAVSFVPSETKTYTVSGTDVKGCSKTSSVNVKVNQLPTVTISMNGPNTYCSNKLTELVASNGVSYLWNDGTTSKTIKPNQSGSYFVKVTDINGCSASSEPVYLTVDDCASIDQLAIQTIQIFPNPTTDLLSVEVSEDLIQLTYKIMDVTGKELVSEKLKHTLNTIDVEDLASGTYFFEIENGYKTKFIKQ